jgi:tetratricopeptide (TPR) repeat protein
LVQGMVSGGRVQESPLLNLLIVTARPNEEKDVGYRTISRPMVEAIRDGALRVNVEIARPGTYEAFVRHVEAKPEGFYHVVHFDLHGGLMTYEQFRQVGQVGANYSFQRGYGLADIAPYGGVKAFLFFEGEVAGQAVPMTADEMAARLQGRGIPVCLLNACQSGKQVQPSPPDPLPEGEESLNVDERETSLGARLMDAGMQMVVAMGYSVTVDAAKLLMQRLYGELFGGRRLPEALRLGRRELFERKQRRVYFNQQVELEDWLLPVVYGNQPVDFRLRSMTLAEESAYFAQQTNAYRFAGATYGFVGRDLDILKVEKSLLRHGVLLVQGMGGTGKTTLLRYLQEWWVQTGFVEQVFYFGYDTKAWTLEQMMFTIAQSLFPEPEMRSFQAMPLAAQMGKLVQVMRLRPLCLMLDNLESVTGLALAIQNTLPEEEQGRIRDFLERVAGGKTRVLLGSRGREEWLRSSFTKDGIEYCYELRGLDGEARSQLAKKVLERHVPDLAKRQAILADGQFERLMRLLAGYPLAIEVVLANVGRQSVADVLAGLDSADVGLDSGSGDKTESILKCVEYSHSNLSAEAQKLLLCLAPFSGFVHRGFLTNYAQELQKLEPFQDYPFEQFDGAVEEAISWGLLSPLYDDDPRLLSIQPMFPYFLKTKWVEKDESTREALRTGFKNYYLRLAGDYNHQLMESKDAQKRHLGIFFCKLEYENLYGALQICLEKQGSISIFFCLYKYFELTNDIQSNLQLSEFACEKLMAFPSKFLQGEQGYQIPFALQRLGNCYLSVQNYVQAQQQYKQALEKYDALEAVEERQKKRWIATGYHQLGKVAAEQRQYEEARNYYQQALQIAIEFGDRYEQARTYHNLGNVAQGQQQYKEAHDYYQKALQLFIEFDDYPSQATTYYQLGSIAQEEQQSKEAHDYCQKALQLFIEYGDRYSQASTYHQLGIIAQNEQQYEEARTNYQQTLQIYIEFDDRYEQARAYQGLGSVAQEKQQYEEARANYQQALQIFVAYDDRYSQAITYGQLGLLAEAEGNISESRTLWQQVLEIFTEFGDEDSGAIAQQNLDRLAG